MSALSIGLAWVALATVAFLVLSASALARTHRDLEADPTLGEDPWIQGLRPPTGAGPKQTLTVPAGPRTLWTSPLTGAPQRRLGVPATSQRRLGIPTAPQRGLGVARRERRGALADAS
jgi:hypothetical protein